MKAWHTFRSSFYRKPTTLQMKTADHKIIDSKLIETRRLMMLETSPWCQPIQELSTSWSRPSPWTLKLLSLPSRVGHPVFRALAHCGPLCLARQLKLLFSTSPKTVYAFLFGTNEHRLSFGNIPTLGNHHPTIPRVTVLQPIPARAEGHRAWEVKR